MVALAYAQVIPVRVVLTTASADKEGHVSSAAPCARKPSCRGVDEEDQDRWCYDELCPGLKEHQDVAAADQPAGRREANEEEKGGARGEQQRC